MARSNARAWMSAAPSSLFRSMARLIEGRIAVPSAVPMIDSGSWFRRSA
jgi:hypothetical protein